MKELFEMIGKALLIFAAVTFSAGLLITNIDLAHYGVRSFSLDRPEYILVGAVWGTFTLLLCVPALAAIRIGITRFTDFLRPNSGVPVLMAIALTTFFIRWLLPDLGPYDHLFPWVVIAGTEIILLASVILGPGIPNANRSDFISHRTRQGLCLAWMGCISLPGYAVGFFPDIKPEFGGGVHPKAILLLRLPDKTTPEQISGIVRPIQVHDLTTEVVTVLLIEGDYVAVTAGRYSRAILVSKSLVGAIAYR